MIQIRKQRDSDTPKIKSFLEGKSDQMKALVANGLTCFLVEEGERILGVAAYKNEGEIHGLFIDENFRALKLGDGLFRAVLNHFDLLGISEVLVFSQAETYGFFASEPIEPVSMPGQNGVFKVLLPDFFNRPCKGNS